MEEPPAKWTRPRFASVIFGGPPTVEERIAAEMAAMVSEAWHGLRVSAVAAFSVAAFKSLTVVDEAESVPAKAFDAVAPTVMISPWRIRRDR